MEVIITAVIAWAIAQLSKIIIHLIKTKKLNLRLLTATGGMPSSHTAFVVAATVRIGMLAGIESALFGASVVFSLVVIQDAVGVRQSVGKQAQALNKIQQHLKVFGIDIDRIYEVMGHNIFQVSAGLVLGLLVGLFVGSGEVFFMTK